MRVIGTIALLAGTWPLWRALTGHDALDAGGVVMAFTGLALLSGRRWTRAFGVEEGGFAGLCVTNGIALAAWGTFMLFAYSEFASAHLNLPVRSLTSPLLFLGCGVLLIVAGLRRARTLLHGPGESDGGTPAAAWRQGVRPPGARSGRRGDPAPGGQPHHSRGDRSSRPPGGEVRAAPRGARADGWRHPNSPRGQGAADGSGTESSR